MVKKTHYSVLLKESIGAVISSVDGTYIDCTFGRGGHSEALLKKLGEKARVIAFDKDPEAVAVGRKLSERDPRFTIMHGSFVELERVKDMCGLDCVDGILMDLGVSSPQLDDAERGFSFLHDGPLDMRMNSSSGQTAATWINNAEEGEIALVLKNYGEERFAKRMAKAIVATREKTPFSRTQQLADVISQANPKWERGKHPATRAFQAIRIKVNRELEELQESLPKALGMLKSGGRMVVISFHSLEDRIVKRFFKEEAKGDKLPARLPLTEMQINRRLKLISSAQRASAQEIAENIRSRSAVMRVAEKI